MPVISAALYVFVCACIRDIFIFCVGFCVPFICTCHNTTYVEFCSLLSEPTSMFYFTYFGILVYQIRDYYFCCVLSHNKLLDNQFSIKLFLTLFFPFEFHLISSFDQSLQYEILIPILVRESPIYFRVESILLSGFFLWLLPLVHVVTPLSSTKCCLGILVLH